jgi:transcriptional regulator with XRE-family HTH domain
MEAEDLKNKELIELGKRIRELRLKAKLTQDDLGFELGFGGGSSISNYEKASREISHTALLALARVFNEYLGDHTYYLIMGQQEDSPSSQRASDSNYFNKGEAIDALTKLIPTLIQSRDIRLSGQFKPSQLIQLICKKAFGSEEQINTRNAQQ